MTSREANGGPLTGPTTGLPLTLARVLDAALARSGPVELSADGDGVSAEQRYLSARLAFSERFGEPDWPGDDHDAPSALGLSDDAALAIWDFDYYMLSLRVDGDRVLLERHENG